MLEVRDNNINGLPITLRKSDKLMRLDVGGNNIIEWVCRFFVKGYIMKLFVYFLWMLEAITLLNGFVDFFCKHFLLL